MLVYVDFILGKFSINSKFKSKIKIEIKPAIITFIFIMHNMHLNIIIFKIILVTKIIIDLY